MNRSLTRVVYMVGLILSICGRPLTAQTIAGVRPTNTSATLSVQYTSACVVTEGSASCLVSRDRSRVRFGGGDTNGTNVSGRRDAITEVYGIVK